MESVPGLPKKSAEDLQKKILYRRKMNKLYREISKLKVKVEESEKEANLYKAKYHKTKDNFKTKQIASKRLNLRLKSRLTFCEETVKSLRNNISSIKNYKEKNILAKALNCPTVTKRSPDSKYVLVNKYYKTKINSLLEAKKVSKSQVNKENAQRSVEAFFLKDENTTPSPRVKDVKKFRQNKKRKRFLNDTVDCLYKKYVFECKKKKEKIVCRANFFKLKPFWVVKKKCRLEIRAYVESIRTLNIYLKGLFIISAQSIKILKII